VKTHERDDFVKLGDGLETSVDQERGGDVRDAEVAGALEGFLQGIETRDTEKGVGLAADDHLDDGRGAFGDEDVVTERLRFGLDGGDGTGAAAGAFETEGVVDAATDGDLAQAVGKKEKPAGKGDGGETVAPEFVGERDHGEAEEVVGKSEASEERAGELFEARTAEGRGEVDVGDETAGVLADFSAEERVGGDALER
jgi:hypothetical protein